MVNNPSPHVSIASGSPQCSLWFSLLFSATLRGVPLLFQTAKPVPAANCFSQHKSPQRETEKK